MNAEMVSSDNKLDMDVANVQTASGRELPIEFHGEMKVVQHVTWSCDNGRSW